MMRIVQYMHLQCTCSYCTVHACTVMHRIVLVLPYHAIAVDAATEHDDNASVGSACIFIEDDFDKEPESDDEEVEEVIVDLLEVDLSREMDDVSSELEAYQESD